MKKIFAVLVLTILSVFSVFRDVSASYMKPGEYQVARIYFLGSGIDTYKNPHTDAKVHTPSEPCEAKYKYACGTNYVGLGRECEGKYATPCVCDPVFNKDCSHVSLIGAGSSCDGKYKQCQCGYSYNKSCTGKYEGVGEACTLDASNPLYQNCKCNSSYQDCPCGMGPGADACTVDGDTKLPHVCPVVRTAAIPGIA